VVDADLVISETSEQVEAVSRPGEGYAIGDSLVRALALRGRDLRLELSNHLLGLQVPDLDGDLSGSNQPVPVGGEDHGVDNRSGFQRVQVLLLLQVPEHGSAVLSAGSAEGTIGRDSDSVQVSLVVLEGVLQQLRLGVLEVPDLDLLVPAARNEEGRGRSGGESDARHPFVVSSSLGIALGIVDQVVLHLAEGIPELDGAVTASRDDLSIVTGESDRQNVLSVADESADAVAISDVPKAESAVPGGGDSALGIGGEDNIRHEVVVASQSSLGIAIVALSSVDAPNDDGLVAGSRDDDVGVLSRG